MIKNKPFDIRLSPTAVNCFFRSPRLFYYEYIKRLKRPPNIHLYKGSFIHRILDKLFASPKYVNMMVFCEKQLNAWNPGKLVQNLTDDEKNAHFIEATKILETFCARFENKLDMILFEGKAKDKDHAWNLAKPRLREYKIHDKERNVVGIIDSIETSFDNQTYVIDYKTSKLYQHTLPEEYVRQVSIYAYLFEKKFGRKPSYVGVHYLRYGEVFLIPVFDELIEKAKKDIDVVRQKIRETRKIDDYPKGQDKFALQDIEYYEQKTQGTSTT